VLKKNQLWQHDIVLLLAIFILAGCGLIYEYLIAHYAARIIGAVETVVYAMIGTMIVAMGIGSFLARKIQCPYRGFIRLELMIGLLGSTSILMMAAVVAWAYILPDQLRQIYGLHPTIFIGGWFSHWLDKLSFLMPFITGFLLGLLVGMEIPLIARIRENEYQQHLIHNTGTIYGVDYLGAGFGAAIWVLFCLSMPVMTAATLTAAANVSVGAVFLIRYRQRLGSVQLFWWAHGVLALLLLFLFTSGSQIVDQMNDTLFKDRVIYEKPTPYQHLALTQRYTSKGLPSAISLYINGRLQFSSSDEMLYHSFLTAPVILASARHQNILVIGGGDGLAARELFKWNPHSITLVDLDRDMIDLFSGRDSDAPGEVTHRLLALNHRSFLDPRMHVIIGDAFIEAENMIRSGKVFDLIVVDLPDPSRPDLNKLYSGYFYSRLRELLSGDGAIVIQSTSPYHAKKAFLCIQKTLSMAGFQSQQYHANVPSFGEWGWTIGTKMGRYPSERIAASHASLMQGHFLSKKAVQAAFVFYPSYYDDLAHIRENRLGSLQLFHYHHDAWAKKDGFFSLEPLN